MGVTYITWILSCIWGVILHNDRYQSTYIWKMYIMWSMVMRSGLLIFVTSFSSMKATAHLLYIIFSAKVRNVFYKLNVHAGRFEMSYMLCWQNCHFNYVFFPFSFSLSLAPLSLPSSFFSLPLFFPHLPLPSFSLLVSKYVYVTAVRDDCWLVTTTMYISPVLIYLCCQIT